MRCLWLILVTGFVSNVHATPYYSGELATGYTKRSGAASSRVIQEQLQLNIQDSFFGKARMGINLNGTVKKASDRPVTDFQPNARFSLNSARYDFSYLYDRNEDRYYQNTSRKLLTERHNYSLILRPQNLPSLSLNLSQTLTSADAITTPSTAQDNAATNFLVQTGHSLGPSSFNLSYQRAEYDDRIDPGMNRVGDTYQGQFNVNLPLFAGGFLSLNYTPTYSATKSDGGPTAKATSESHNLSSGLSLSPAAWLKVQSNYSGEFVKSESFPRPAGTATSVSKTERQSYGYSLQLFPAGDSTVTLGQTFSESNANQVSSDQQSTAYSLSLKSQMAQHADLTLGLSRTLADSGGTRAAESDALDSRLDLLVRDGIDAALTLGVAEVRDLRARTRRTGFNKGILVLAKLTERINMSLDYKIMEYDNTGGQAGRQSTDNLAVSATCRPNASLSLTGNYTLNTDRVTHQAIASGLSSSAGYRRGRLASTLSYAQNKLPQSGTTSRNYNAQVSYDFTSFAALSVSYARYVTRGSAGAGSAQQGAAEPQAYPASESLTSRFTIRF